MVRLNMPNEMGVRSMSGMDSRGLNTSMYFQTSVGTDATQDELKLNEVFVVCACTSILRIGQGRMIEVVI